MKVKWFAQMCISVWLPGLVQSCPHTLVAIRRSQIYNVWTVNCWIPISGSSDSVFRMCNSRTRYRSERVHCGAVERLNSAQAGVLPRCLPSDWKHKIIYFGRWTIWYLAKTCWKNYETKTMNYTIHVAVSGAIFGEDTHTPTPRGTLPSSKNSNMCVV